MPKLFTVHFTLTETDERLADTVTAKNPKEAEQIVRKAYTGQPLALRKVKFVKGSGNEDKRSDGGSTN